MTVLSYIGLFCVLNGLFSRITINKSIALCLFFLLFKNCVFIQNSRGGRKPLQLPSIMLVKASPAPTNNILVSQMSVTTSRQAELHVHPALEDLYMMDLYMML